MELLFLTVDFSLKQSLKEQVKVGNSRYNLKMIIIIQECVMHEEQGVSFESIKTVVFF